MRSRYPSSSTFASSFGPGPLTPAIKALIAANVAGFLAALVVPFALTTIYRAWRGQFARHMRIARWTLPLWLYVSITGVIVYWMLYHLVPPP